MRISIHATTRFHGVARFAGRFSVLRDWIALTGRDAAIPNGFIEIRVAQ